MATARSNNAQRRVRSLRVGIILGGQIIEEKLFREYKPITIGHSYKNTFCTPTAGIKKTFEIFAVRNGKYVLQFDENMDGRVSDGGEVKTLGQMRDSNIAQRLGGTWALPLPNASRGKVTVGGLTVLFQFVNAPPLQPRPQLPASVRGTMAERIEPRLAITMLASISFFTVLMILATLHDIPISGLADRVFNEFEEETTSARVFERPKTAPTEVSDDGTADTTAPATSTKPSKKPAGAEKPDDSGGGGDNNAPDDAAIEETIDSSVFMRALTGSTGQGGRYEKMLSTDQGTALATQIDGVKRSGSTVASAGRAGAKSTRGPSSGRIGTSRGPGVSGPGKGGRVGGKTVEEKIRSKASFDVEDIDDTSLDPSKVANKIRSRYIAAIKRCHQQVLKVDPRAGGRVELRITIGMSGKVTKARVRGFNPQVDGCIKKLTRRWRFSVPKDEDNKPTSADFIIPLLLKPF